MAWDVIIIGGGPAGLSAALVLGRCRRRVLLYDDGSPRNEVARRSHGFFTRDHTPPEELRRIGRAQLAPYGVQLREGRVTQVRPRAGGFEVRLEGAAPERCRKLLLATGVRDRLPPLSGIEPLYGHSVFHCPYCDGWEMRDQPLAGYARGPGAAEWALALKTWSGEVTLVSDGFTRFSPADVLRLRRNRVGLRAEAISRLEARGRQLQRIHFVTGRPLTCRAMFIELAVEQRSEIPAALGCAMNRKGCVKPGKLEQTNVPGVYCAGDASRDVQSVVVAAAEGAKAAMGINRALREEDTR